MSASNEAEPDQLDVARVEGGTYAQALEAMDEESGAVTQRAGDDLVAFVQENAEGTDELDDGRLVWREAAEEANVHLEIAVADAADGRFEPAVDVTLTLLDGDEELFSTTLPFLWHPYL
jgi:thioredoxin-like negative regulator of GroEL